MKLSKYGILEDSDIIKKDDEIRCIIPYSHMTLYADESLDYGRKQWMPVTEYWIGKYFGIFRKGAIGKWEGRRKIKSEVICQKN